MKFLEAALAVLAQADRPLTSREVAEAVMERHLVQTSGRTPEASLTAALYVALREDRAPGLERLFEPGPTRARRGSVRWRYRPR
ncbi:MAG: winged helix-turn-helix domain-containing protein [Candidatus Limnocylindrales bacterium]